MPGRGLFSPFKHTHPGSFLGDIRIVENLKNFKHMREVQRDLNTKTAAWAANLRDWGAAGPGGQRDWGAAGQGRQRGQRTGVTGEQWDRGAA